MQREEGYVRQRLIRSWCSLLVCERTCSHIFPSFASGKCMESAPASPVILVREPQSPALAQVSRAIETCAQAAGFQSAEGVVPCFSQGDCDGYDTEFGEPCCLVRYVTAAVSMSQCFKMSSNCNCCGSHSLLTLTYFFFAGFEMHLR